MKNKTKIILLSVIEIIIFLFCFAFSGTFLKMMMDAYGNAKFDVLWTVLTILGCAIAAALIMAIIAIFIIKLSKKTDE